MIYLLNVLSIHGDFDCLFFDCEEAAKTAATEALEDEETSSVEVIDTDGCIHFKQICHEDDGGTTEWTVLNRDLQDDLHDLD